MQCQGPHSNLNAHSQSACTLPNHTEQGNAGCWLVHPGPGKVEAAKQAEGAHTRLPGAMRDLHLLFVPSAVVIAFWQAPPYRFSALACSSSGIQSKIIGIEKFLLSGQKVADEHSRTRLHQQAADGSSSVIHIPAPSEEGYSRMQHRIIVATGPSHSHVAISPNLVIYS